MWLPISAYSTATEYTRCQTHKKSGIAVGIT